MQFFNNYFNKHHFFHAPHLWFFALLSSPIHFAEIHYQKRYHLKYENAKKLFIFDATLFLTILALIGTTIFWFTYNPGVANLVYLSIKPSSTRILSGEYVTYNISYKNSSPVTLTSPKLKIKLPTGFVLDKTEPADNFQNFIFTLPNIPSQTTGSVSLSGWIYGTPNKEEELSATLSYIQEKRKVEEEKGSLFIKTLRGSLLESKISAPRYIPANETAPLTLTLKNNSDQSLNKIRVPLTQTVRLFPASATTTLGIIQNNIWQIESLAPKASAEIKLTLDNDAKDNPQKLTATFIPSININQTNIPQTATEHVFLVAYPKVELSLNWQNQTDYASPQGVATLQISLKNTGNINLANGELSLGIPPALLDIPRFSKLNLGQEKNQIWKINSEQLASLKTLKINEEVNYNLQIPIAFSPQGGTDLTYAPTITFSAVQENVPTSYYNTELTGPTLKIGTQVLLQPEARYFTKEGDQLGRGPLPPQVGKETKYWIFFPIANSTSRIKDVKLNANLPSYISWTGKTSVSYGSNPTFDAATNKISWFLNSLPPHTPAGVYFEVSFVPSLDQVDTTPILLKNISFSATDSYTGAGIQKNLDDLDTSLKNDSQAQEQGVRVVE